MLSGKSLEIIDYIEQQYLLEGTIPSYEEIKDIIPVGEKTWLEYWNDTDFTNALEVRGIKTKLSSEAISTKKLSAEQIAVVNALLDPVDRRPDNKKMQDLGIPTTKLQGWMKDPVFFDYFQRRSEQIFENAKGEILKAHIDKAKAGDISAINLYYKMVGRFDDRGESIDIRRFILYIVDILSKHVKNVETLGDIVREIESFGQLSGPTIIDSTVQPKEIAQ